MLSPQLVKEYNKVRINTDKDIICHAPFVSLNFGQNGNIRACCYNISDILGTYPQNSIMEAWTGKQAEALRTYIKENNLGGGCAFCDELIKSKNFLGSKALNYDIYVPQPEFKQKIWNGLTGKQPNDLPLYGKYPRVMEFELSNVCNLECEMCDGFFSSAIRKNREKLPPMVNPYDDRFVEQVAELIPYLTEMKFLGGEPFLIDIYFKIWDKIAAINPEIRVHITTNGTVMNQRVRELVKTLNCAITVSVDSLQPDNYERIRAGAKYNRVMQNINEFIQIAKEKNRLFSLSICPMTLNWHELPDFVRFANERGIDTYYNTVWRPEHLSLRYVKPKVLRKAVAFLNQQEFINTTRGQKLNVDRYREVVNTFSYWLNTKATDPANFYVKLNEQQLLAVIPAGPIAKRITLLALQEKLDITGYENYPAVEKIINAQRGLSETDDEPEDRQILSIARACDKKEFVLAYLSSIIALQKIFYNDTIDSVAFEQKINSLMLVIQSQETMNESVYSGTLKHKLVKRIPSIANKPINVLLKAYSNP